MERYNVVNELDFVKQPIRNGDINLDNVTSITGVYNFDIVASDLLNCRLFLFGDLHVMSRNGFVDQDNGSLYLPLYLDALFKKHNDKQFDFMMELTPSEEANNLESRTDTVFKSIVKQFNVCYQGISNKAECSKEWPNVRFHNIDIRDITEGFAKNNQFFTKIRSLMDFYHMLTSIMVSIPNEKTPEHLEIFMKLIKSKFPILDEINNNGQGSYFIRLMKSDNKYRRYATVKNIEWIDMYVENNINVILSSSQIFRNMRFLEQKDFISYYEVESIVHKTRDLIFQLMIQLTDHYTFVRFMKILDYNVSNNTSNANKSRGSNIIVLEGNKHIENFKNFVKTVDPTSYFIRGSCDLEDNMFNNANQLLNEVGQFKIPNQLRVGLDSLHIIYRELVDYLLKNHNQYEKYQIDAARKIISIIEMKIRTRENTFMRVFTSNNRNRILKIQSSVIENSLVL